jgi:lipoprotein-anchoring transpeptidase ErfK/SrfK
LAGGSADILQRHRELTPDLQRLPGGLGLPGGEDNPLGARALYLWEQNRDIRIFNDDVVDLYDRVSVGAKVAVLPSAIS